MDDYKQARLIKICENPYIKDFIDKNNLSPSYICDNFTPFDECLASLELCKNCPGLNNCPQGKKGEIIGLNFDGFVNNSVVYCKHYLLNDKYVKQAESYVYSDIPSINYDLSLKNIVLDEEELKVLFGLCYGIYEGSSNKGLYIFGDLGVGKTYMTIALANSLVANGKKVAFIKVNDFVTKMSQLIREDVNEYEKEVKRIKRAEYVILDDIGSETVTEFSRDRLLFNILDYRMENKLCTIFTSNLDKDSLLKHYSIEQDSIKAKRLLERIEILSDNYCLKGLNKRRISQ